MDHGLGPPQRLLSTRQPSCAALGLVTELALHARNREGARIPALQRGVAVRRVWDGISSRPSPPCLPPTDKETE